MQLLINFPETFRSMIGPGRLMLSKKVSLWKTLQLPDVTWLEMLAATVCLVVLIWAILRLVARVNEDVDPAEADKQMLQALSDLRREGQVTDDEFRSIKSQIVGRLKNEWGDTSSVKEPAGSATLQEALRLKLIASTTSKETTDNEGKPEQESSQSDQSETLTSPTNVPRPLQDNDKLTEGSEPPNSEEGFGKSDVEKN